MSPAPDVPVDHIRAMVGNLRRGTAVTALDLNRRVIERCRPPTGPVRDASIYRWSARVDASYSMIRSEYEALLDEGFEVPLVEEVAGSPQGNSGPWRSYVLSHMGEWFEWNCRRCPGTTALARSVPDLQLAAFSILDPGTSIEDTPHLNKGALRYQLPLIVAEQGCGMRIAGEDVRWIEGRGVLIDFAHPHRLWNQSEQARVVLMLEVPEPLGGVVGQLNRLAQRSMRLMPETRGMRTRLERLEYHMR